MSRAWINFYMGDYQKKTNHLTLVEHGAYFLLLQECWANGRIPLEPVRRAAICKITLKEWNKLAPVINPFFREDGTNKRAVEEINKVDDARVRRSISAQKAGRASQISQSIARARTASIERDVERTLSNRPAYVERMMNAEQPNLDKNITTTSSEAAREVFDEQTRLEQKKAALQASPELIAILNGKTRR
jgi:uncharacterized protein YdaU (DUF1376 family)